MRRFALPLLALVVLAGGLLLAPRRLTSRTAVSPDFAHWESGHVRPAAMTPDGTRLLVVNTPDNRLTVFDLTGAAPARVAEIPVGLEPVAVACLDNGTAWVVNQLSDDVSVVDLTTLHVRATVRVGDEPSDVVFAGSPVRAYVSVSHEDRIRVYDPNAFGAPLINVPLRGRMPRALAASHDGAFVYAAVFHAGNRTSVVPFDDIPVGSMPADPQFPRSPSLPPTPPRVGLIVERQGTQWRDMYGGNWTAKLPYDVGDHDVVKIATFTKTVADSFGGLGAVNYALAVSPANGQVAVTSTEARNLLRFEPRLRGHTVDTQLGLISAAGAVAPLRNLNPHVNYAVTPGPATEADSALGIPTGAAYSPDGQRLYVTSLASNRLGVLDPAGSGVLARVPTVAGPTGVVVDGARGRIYVVGRFHNQLQTLSAATLAPVAVTGIGFDPTPDEFVNGRKFFYGGFTSGHGEQACASCHLFGDFDNLAWDLGDPAGAYLPAPPGMIDPLLEGFDPMKGPMTTQSLRGLPGTGLLHWRGDRANLSAFNDAFVGLMGRATTLPDSEMSAFNDFTLALAYPPNPHQRLNRTQPDAPPGQPSALSGQTLFMNRPIDGGLRCNDCHTAATGGTNGQIINDAALLEDQDVKIPQLRNMYKKTGFSQAPGAVNKRGFGFIHDGSVDNLFEFLKFPGFSFTAGATGDAERRDVEAFMHAFDTGIAPAVGYQLTFDGANHTALALARLDTLRGQAAAPPGNCDLIAKGRLSGAPRGWKYQAASLAWRSDRSSESLITTGELLALAGPGTEITVTGVPLGSGARMGIDRDRDSFFDTDETDAGSDPANPASTPLNVAVPGDPDRGFALHSIGPNPFRDATEIRFALGGAGLVDAAVYDVLGREVEVLARGLRLEAGAHQLRWAGRGAAGTPAPAGVYFVRIATEGGRWTRPVVRVR